MYDTMTEEQKIFVDDLVRVSIIEIVRPNEVDKMIEDDVYRSVDDW